MFRFKLRTLLIVTTLVAVLMVCICVLFPNLGRWNSRSPNLEPVTRVFYYGPYYSNGNEFRTHLNDAVFANNPTWNGLDGHPPLSDQTAINAATEYMQALIDSGQLIGSSDVRYTCPQTYRGDHHFWLVRFPITNDHEERYGPDFIEILVLMDGSVIPPTIVERDDSPE